ncbi:hypothetical protein V6N13_130773 [Hibiscus sabdariffa]
MLVDGRNVGDVIMHVVDIVGMETTLLGDDGDALMVGSEGMTRAVEPLLDGFVMITIMGQNPPTEIQGGEDEITVP